MALTFFNGEVVSDGTEQNLFDITADKHFATWIHFDQLIAGDTFQVRVYLIDTQDATERKYIDTEVAGAQTSPAFFIPFIPAKEYRVSLQRTSATNRTISWQRAEA